MLLAWAFQLTVGSGFSPDLEHAGGSFAGAGRRAGRRDDSAQHGRLAVGLIVSTSLAMAWLAGTAEGLAPAIGVRCAFRELWAAGLTWIIAGTVARRVDAPLNRWKLTAVVASGALAAHAGQHLACEVPHSHGHLLLFHFGAVLLAVVERRWGRRWPPAGAGRRAVRPCPPYAVGPVHRDIVNLN